MLTLEEIQAKFLRGERENTFHALERMTERNITVVEIVEAMQNAECIEQYPLDKYGASMLI